MTHTPARKPSEPTKSLKLEEIAKLVGGEIIGNKEISITGVAGIKEAKKGDITFLSNEKYLPFLDQTQASVVITSREIQLSQNGKVLLRTDNPSLAFDRVLSLFVPARAKHAPGIHASAIVSKSAKLGKNVYLGPHTVLEDAVRIGDNVSIEAGSFVGADSSIGDNTHIYPNVTLREQTKIGRNVIIHSGTVIGSDGFGYDTIDGKHLKIPHRGNVEIQDDVEIGANVCIDRGRFKTTLIQKGTKIDNLVQIAHNVIVGENNLIVSQAGISGSSETGKNVIIAGQAGIVGHITIGDDAIIGAKTGITKSVEPKSVMLGSPAKPISEQKRIFALISKLPELFKDIQELKRRVFGKTHE